MRRLLRFALPSIPRPGLRIWLAVSFALMLSPAASTQTLDQTLQRLAADAESKWAACDREQKSCEARCPAKRGAGFSECENICWEDRNACQNEASDTLRYESQQARTQAEAANAALAAATAQAALEARIAGKSPSIFVACTSKDASLELRVWLDDGACKIGSFPSAECSTSGPVIEWSQASASYSLNRTNGQLSINWVTYNAVNGRVDYGNPKSQSLTYACVKADPSQYKF